MSEPTLGEIRMFAGSYAPYNWSLANGQTLAIEQYQALYSLFKTHYGGDGRLTFKLPDMRARIPVHFGQGAGLRNWELGAKAGFDGVQLTTKQMPRHLHNPAATTAVASSRKPGKNMLARVPEPAVFYKIPAVPYRSMSPQTLDTAGEDKMHNNVMRYQTLTFIVCMKGAYPVTPPSGT